MNSCVLMAKIVRNPQLRYTQDNQMAVTEMMVEFDNPSPNNPPCNLKVIAWGNLATDVSQKYQEGNQVILTGRLKMDLLERQGYKEKIAELTISNIYPLNEIGNNVVPFPSSSKGNNDESNFAVDEVETYSPTGDDPIPF